MSEELITPENLSTELLKAVLDASGNDIEVGADGELHVRDACRCLVLPCEGTVQLISRFRLKPEADRARRLECANEINDTYVATRAVVTENDTLLFDYTICVAGGITRKALVLAVRRFCSTTAHACYALADDLVE